MPIKSRNALHIVFRGIFILSFTLYFSQAAYGFQVSPLSGTINVGSGQTYTSLTNSTGLFAAINSAGLSANVVVRITSDLTEDGTVALRQWQEAGIGNYTVTIQPDGVTNRLVSGNAPNGLIRLDGAKRLTIDGNNGSGTGILTLRNTNTALATGTAIIFINGASDNKINYCNIQAAANATNGAVLFGTTNAASGNNNNFISNSVITSTVSGNTGFTAIYSSGTSGKENTGNIISSNSIINFRERAIDLAAGGNTGWTITANSIFNGDVTAAINFANGSNLHGIRIGGGSGHRISTNYIGGNAVQAGGTAAVYNSTSGLISYQGILLTTSAASPVSEIRDNVIANMSVSAVPLSTAVLNVFTGIETNGSGINVEGNLIGSRTMRGSVLVTTTTTSATFRSLVTGIHFKSTGGSLAINQVCGIDLLNIGAAAGASAFTCLLINSAAPPTTISGNIAGSSTLTNSVRVLSTSLSTSTELTGIALGASTAANVNLNGNTVQNLSHLPTAGAGTITGISSSAGAGIGINNNTISTLISNAAGGILSGIAHNSSATLLSISSNTITANQQTGATGSFSGINIGGAAIPAISINANSITANSAVNLVMAISNAAVGSTLNINSNTISGTQISGGTGLFTAITNSAATTSTIQIRSNNIGTADAPAVTFTAANTAAQNIISNSGGGAASSLTIGSNTIRGITYAVAGSGSQTFVANTSAALNRSITANSFTNLDLNTSGNVSFISDNVAIAATGTQNINSNSISGSFAKSAGGSVAIFSSSVTSATGSVSNQSANNFSNITLTGATAITGWTCTDGGSGTKNIQNNIFSNWAGASGGITVMSVNISGTNSTSGNNINTIAGTGNVTGISSAAGNDNIFLNTIFALSSSGATAVVEGIEVTGGNSKNIYRNKLYDFTASSAGGSVNGIVVFAGLSITITNNIIGDLKTPAGNSTTDIIRGISIPSSQNPSNINVYYNTVYINATSTGTNFSTSAIYHTGAGLLGSTIATLDMRNNSLTNTSTPKGSGTTVVHRVQISGLENFTGNNNLLYAGVASASRLLYQDALGADQTLLTYKLRLVTREGSTVSENVTTKYSSTIGSSPFYLHMNPGSTSALDNAGAALAGFTEDFDGQPRLSPPDIGADEINAAESIQPVITYTALANTTSTANRSLSNVTITDNSGINTAVGLRPRLYFKRSIDANQWIDNTSSSNGWKFVEATGTTTPFTFTINYSLLYKGESQPAGVIQYFVVAQDLATVPNVNINSGNFSNQPTSVALTTQAFPLTGTIRTFNIPFAGNFPVGSNEVFTTLTSVNGIFETVNLVGLMGNTVFSINTDLTEDGTNALNQWTESGTGNYTMTIQPDAGASRNISGSIASALIRLNGADRVTIDGSQSAAGNYLTIRNNNISGTGSTILLQNGATNNAIKNIIAESAGNQTNGVINFGSSASAGNSNNTVSNSVINSTISSVQGITGIYSAGTTGFENSTNSITNNTIIGYRERAIDITATGSSAWTISANKVYNSSTAYTTAASLQGIRILGGSGYTIQNNKIGGDSLGNSTVSYTSTLATIDFAGIRLNSSASTPASLISGNEIRNITVSSLPDATNARVLAGIDASGAGISIRSNIIRYLSNTSSSSNGALALAGITVSNAASGDISANRVFNLSLTATAGQAPGITGINLTNSSLSVYNNVIGINTIANSVYGIQHNSTLAANYFYNTVNLNGSGSSATRSAAFIRTATGTIVLQNNILLNKRTGAGNNYAVSNIAATPATDWTVNSALNNALYGLVANNLGEWGAGNSLNFANWKLASQSDNNSVNTNVVFQESLLDLVPDSSTNCRINNAGIPVAVSADIRGTMRNVTTPDIGAYEFNYVAYPVIASNNSPVCAGSAFQLSVTTGAAVGPTYRWTNAADSLISLLQNPTITSAAGLYKIAVTDFNGCLVNATTNVTLTPRPTGKLTAPAKICEGSPANITITVTGSGTISGTLSTGGAFSGTAPTIVVPITPTTDTKFYLATLTDLSCTAIRTDIPDSVLVLVSHAGDWLGVVSNDWRNAANWCGGVPASTTNVFIASALPNYPLINTGVNPALNLVLQTGASLTVDGATLQLFGNITNQGTITATNGTIQFNGAAAQTIPAGVFAGNSLKGLTVNNTAGVTLNGPLAITDLFSVTGGQLNTNGNLTLKSNASGTARLGPVTSVAATPVNGAVTVERYVPGRRKYRIITSSVTTSPLALLPGGQESLSIWGNWQNQGNNAAVGIGNFITGGTVADGFDPQTQNPSVFTYDAVNRVYVPFSSAKGNNTKTTPLKAGIPYYMFVFGDRRNTVITTTPNNTTLIAKGQLITGDQTYSTASSIPLEGVMGRFTMLGNPFASPINWALVSKSNIADTYWGWDPNLSSTGGYVTVSTIGNTVITAPYSGATGLNQFIQAGQGFFVRTTGPSPTLVIAESHKSATNNPNAFRQTDVSETKLLAVNLLYKSGVENILADGTVAVFGNDGNAIKMLNNGENIGVSAAGDYFSIHGRSLKENDTVFLRTTKLSKPVYELEIFSKGLTIAGPQPYLEDRYLRSITKLSLSDTNRIRVEVNNGIAASSDENRFRILFAEPGIVPRPDSTGTRHPEVRIYPNPVRAHQLKMQISGDGKIDLQIYNSMGREVHRSSQLINAGGQVSVNLDQRIPAGIYSLLITINNKKFIRKIFVE